ncbi:aminotransferase class IV family protein [Paracoccus sp. WLY502]|uniref:aminotransferase class IV family protein n=1 Tax=Paracoccus yibinensis TaxID=3068891 RepID=UPI002796AA1D|nr:aminotransferase class IV family protein [Paracoccus sp. WLY502]MDQ1899713.1 aminotransferase class IV family protein [Paracoccus sp. WLY502]
MQGRIPGPVPEGLTVFETMRVEPDGRIALWPLHLDRLRAGRAAVGFDLDETQVLVALAGLPRGQVLRARLAVDANGHVALTHQPLPPNPEIWQVAISDQHLNSKDAWLRIKSSHRPVYDHVRAGLPAAVDEAILLNERGEVCEGTITSLFLRRGGRLLTPPLSCGLLPGVLRRSLIQTGQAEEAVLTPDELRDGEVFMGNALRGLIRALLV